MYVKTKTKKIFLSPYLPFYVLFPYSALSSAVKVTGIALFKEV